MYNNIEVWMFDAVNITGFQAFGNVPLNPTEQVIDGLRKQPHHKLRRIQKLDVTVRAVDSYIHQLGVSCSPKEGKIINLHLGVGPNKVYLLESCGYNMKDFRIPDNDGLQCKKQKIEDGLGLDHPLETQVDLKWLAEELRKKGHKVDVSKDPGRYICNYIYFNSLAKLCKQNSSSLFVHFPPLAITTEYENMKFVADLIDVLTKKDN